MLIQNAWIDNFLSSLVSGTEGINCCNFLKHSIR